MEKKASFLHPTIHKNQFQMACNVKWEGQTTEALKQRHARLCAHTHTRDPL